MFTGIIEEIGIIRNIVQVEQGAIISVKCSKILDDLNIGDSVAINGACQTVTELKQDGFDVEASAETLNMTTFSNLYFGTKVNLERALSARSRFGGHIVTGHVDGTGSLQNIVNQGIADLYYFLAPDSIAKYMVYKGSICIDGISLTIASLENNIFSISVISQTIKSTNLAYLKLGDQVNLESDILAKYVEKFTCKTNNTSKDISLGYLQENGFI